MKAKNVSYGGMPLDTVVDGCGDAYFRDKHAFEVSGMGRVTRSAARFASSQLDAGMHYVEEHTIKLRGVYRSDPNALWLTTRGISRVIRLSTA